MGHITEVLVKQVVHFYNTDNFIVVSIVALIIVSSWAVFKLNRK